MPVAIELFIGNIMNVVLLSYLVPCPNGSLVTAARRSASAAVLKHRVRGRRGRTVNAPAEYRKSLSPREGLAEMPLPRR